MSGQKSKSLSISFRLDDGVIEHNNREFIANNVDAARISDNVCYVRRDIREMYAELFGRAIEEYNAKQTRADRKIPDYYEHIKKDARLKPFYEVIVQFGDMETCGLKSGKWEQAKLLLDNYMRGFEKRNPNLKIVNAVMHLDEATPHLHIDFVPVAYKLTRGPAVKVSLKNALREQGFTSANRFQNEWAAWEEQERGVMTDILHKHDLSREVKNVRRSHLTIDEYKDFADKQQKIRNINSHINELKKKNPADLTPDEVELINNQNDFLRSEIQKRDESISALSEKIGSKFVPFDIFSEDKLQFVAAELSKINIPFVEESYTLHIPDYAEKTAAAIAASFRPIRAESIRDQIKLEIDRLVYCSQNLDDLYNKLRERSYQIKNGKHLAVKPTYAERFVRLKSLGEEYLPKNLERRIADRDKFPNAVREKFQTASTIERKFHIAIMDLVIEVKKFTITPRKLDPKKIYTFQNDAEIDHLSEQLRTIRDFHFTLSEQMYVKAEELKRGIDEKNAKLKSLSDEIPTLKSDISQLRHLFSVGVNSKPRDTMEQVKLAAACEIANKYGAKSEDDLSDLEKRLEHLQAEMKSIKDELPDDQLKQKRVSDLITAYENIVEGNYIDNLVRARREQDKSLDTASFVK